MNDQQYVQQLQQACSRGERYAYLCFWGHTPKVADSVDKSCFSQWLPARLPWMAMNAPPLNTI